MELYDFPAFTASLFSETILALAQFVVFGSVIAASQIPKSLEKNNKLSKRQHGFRKYRSYESQLTELIRDIFPRLE